MTKLYVRLVRGLQSLCKVSRQSKSKRDTFFSIWDIFFSDESQSFSLAREMCISGTIGDIYGMQAP